VEQGKDAAAVAAAARSAYALAGDAVVTAQTYTNFALEAAANFGDSILSDFGDFLITDALEAAAFSPLGVGLLATGVGVGGFYGGEWLYAHTPLGRGADFIAEHLVSFGDHIASFFESQPVGSFDPNGKIGPGGFGPQGFVGPNEVFPYRIDFENDPTATAPAQRVVITDQLDSHLDWNTFALTEVGFGDFLFTIPAGSQHFQTTVDMTYNGETFQVEIEVGLHSQTGQVYAVFQSVDPRTTLPPDVLTGFLPPEDGTGRGMGHISYIIKPLANLATGHADPQRGRGHV
jgi:hypothetical protein